MSMHTRHLGLPAPSTHMQETKRHPVTTLQHDNTPTRLDSIKTGNTRQPMLNLQRETWPAQRWPVEPVPESGLPQLELSPVHAPVE
ncbi:hypothetical protein E2P81_ATG09166 [Venturia nashicola]|nr:hypothetical protein E2P81_ATG09166 [Venturia nashicola]